MKHLLVSRVAIKWNHPNQKLDWNDWAEKRINMYQTITIPSVVNQSCKDFTLISLVDDSINYEAVLRNEVCLKVRESGSYPQNIIVETLQRYVAGLDKYYDEIIVSRVDSDDLLHHRYIQEVQAAFNTQEPRDYVDIADSYTYELSTNTIRKSGKYDVVTSPFISVREARNDFKALPYAKQHSDFMSGYTGIKTSRVKAMQVIHGNNLLNKVSGKQVDIDLKEFGL